MNSTFRPLCHRRRSLFLAACSDEEMPRGWAGEPAGLEVTDARLVLPAVSGNPAYLFRSDQCRRAQCRHPQRIGGRRQPPDQRYDRMEREMVMGEMGPLTLNAGDSASFEPGGKHVMAFDLDPFWRRRTAMTLTVAGGKS